MLKKMIIAELHLFWLVLTQKDSIIKAKIKYINIQ